MMTTLKYGSVAIILAIAIVQVNGAQGDDLEALCNGRTVDLVSVKQLDSLVKQLDGSACSPDIARAIKELSRLIEEDSDDVCTMDKVNKIKGFYAKYLDSSEGAPARTSKIPKSVERLALAYAMQVSSHCKLQMLGELFEAAVDLSPTEFDELEGLTRDKGALDKLLADTAEPEDIILLVDQAVALSQGKSFVGRELESESDSILRAKQLCQFRFKPIYRPLVEPVAALSRAGFDLPDVILNVHGREHLDVLEQGTKRWARVIFLCEALDSIGMDDIKSAPLELGPNLARGELANSRKSSGGVGPLLITGYDKTLSQLLDSFDTRKTESERIKDKLAKLNGSEKGKSWTRLAPVWGKLAQRKSKGQHLHWENKAENIINDIFKETGMTREELEDAKKVAFGE